MTGLIIQTTFPMPRSNPVYAVHRTVIEEYLESLSFPGGHKGRFLAVESGERGELEHLISNADFLLTGKEPVPEGLIRLGKRLRLIQKLGTRYGNIDIEAATEAGIPVSVIPYFWAVSVAEHTIMLMLSLGKNLVNMHNAVARGDNPHMVESILTTQTYRRFNWLGIGPNILVQLYGKTLGVVGLGEIALEVVKRARSFEMDILYYKRSRLPSAEEVRLGIKFRSLPDLLKESDFVSIHIPHSRETEKLIGAEELALMKPTAFLVNTSRGGIIDQAALVDALNRRVIAGAGLDVYCVEPPYPDDRLLSLRNVILSPHIAGHGPVLRRYKRALDNIAATMMGSKPEGLVNPQVYCRDSFS